LAKTKLTATLIFLFPLCWILFLNQNVPFSTMDDPTIHYLAKTSSYQKIVSRIVNPLTPAWTYQFQALGGEQNSLGLRPVELLIWKTLQSLFGYAILPFYFIKGLFLSLVTVFIFFVCRRITRSDGVSALAALFYATTLACYNSATIITVFDLLGQFIQGIAALLFLRLYLRNQTGSFSVRETLFSCSVLFMTMWLSIKTYETTKIMPMIFSAFIFMMHWRHPIAWLKKRDNQLLLLTLMLMAILVVPFTASYKVYDAAGAVIKNDSGLSYHWDTLYRFVLQNTRNAWEPEQTVALFSLKSELPFSLARTFGFFLCWLTLLGAGAAVFNFRRILQWEEPRRSLFLFLLVWAAADIAALGLPKESDGRHLMAPLIPVTLLAATLIWNTAQLLPQKARKAFAVLCVAGWAFAFFTNAGHNIYFRKFIGGTQIAQDDYMRFLYKDMHGKEPSYEDLTRFMLVPEALCIWHIPFIADDIYGDFDTKIRPERLAGLKEKYGKAYIVTTDPSRVPADGRYKPMAVFDEVNESLFTDWILRFKKKKGALHHVYQFVPA